MAGNYAWGIDIGNRALKAIKLVREGDLLRVDDFEVIEHETVLSNAGDNRESLIQAALASFVQRHQIKGGHVAVGVSGQSSFARFIKLPPVEPKKIPEIVRFEAIQQIPFPLDDVEWSYQLFQAPDSPDVEVGIFAMRKELVNQHITYFTDSDLNVQVVQMNPLAVYNAMYYDSRIKGTTMVIDLGAENTDLIICDEDSIWLRSIPIGGNNFTEALAKAFKLNFQKAEELKRNAASSKYARQIFQAMRPIFADLVAEVQRSIGFYASVHRDSRIKKIIALGGTFKLPGLQKYLQQNLQLEVERLDSLGAGAPSDPKLAATFNDNILSMVSAYGLAIQAMGDAKVNSNLLPARIRRERMWQEKVKWFAAAAALFVLGTGVAYGSWFVNSMAYQNGSQYRTEIQSVLANAQQLDSDWKAIESSGSADRERIKNIRSLTQYRDLWPNLLADLNKALPQTSSDPETLKKTPRNQRPQIVIDSVESRYLPDLTNILAETDLKKYANLAQIPQAQIATAGAAAPAMDMTMDMMGMAPEDYAAMGFGTPTPSPSTPAPAPGSGGRGFLLAVKGVTPYTSGDGAVAFVNDTLVKSLQAIKNDKNLGNRKYYVAKAECVLANKLEQNTQRLTQMKQTYDAAIKAKTTGQVTPGAGAVYAPGGYMPGMDAGDMMDMAPEDLAANGYPGAMPGMTAVPGQPPGAVAPADDPAYKDRATGETMINDWEFTVIVAVVVDPAPPAEEAPADASAAAEPAAP